MSTNTYVCLSCGKSLPDTHDAYEEHLERCPQCWETFYGNFDAWEAIENDERGSGHSDLLFFLVLGVALIVGFYLLVRSGVFWS